MAIQELDLQIRHWSVRSNANADALSRSPLPVERDLAESKTEGVIATAVPDELDLPTLQRQDQVWPPLSHTRRLAYYLLIR